MNRLSEPDSEDPFGDSESWNHLYLYRDSAHNNDVGSIALIICHLDPSASFEIYKGPRARRIQISVSNNRGGV